MPNFNEAEEQKEMTGGKAIPEGSVVKLVANVRLATGDKVVGSHPMFTVSKNNPSNEYVNFEFKVTDGTYEGRTIWSNMVVVGEETAKKISYRTLRAMLESAYGIDPKDMSPKAVAQRDQDWPVFDGLPFMAKVGVEISKDKKYINNTLKLVITPDMPQYAECATMGEIITDVPLPVLPDQTANNPMYTAPAGASKWATGAAASGASAPAPAGSAAPAPSWATKK